MADSKPTPPRTGTEPAADTPEQPATAEKGKPVVLATLPGSEFVLPGEKTDGSDTVRITSRGVAVSEADAKKIREVAASSYVRLVELDGDGQPKPPAEDTDRKDES